MPQTAWTTKDERKYEHIKDSELKRGVALAEAKEIAGRTVNKDRREEGRTPNRRTTGTGNPNTPYEQRTRDELYNVAKVEDIRGRGRMSKADLVRALNRKKSAGGNG